MDVIAGWDLLTMEGPWETPANTEGELCTGLGLQGHQQIYRDYKRVMGHD